MLKQDWQEAFGQAPRSFNDRVDFTLDKIRREEQKMKKHQIISSILAAAMGVVTLGGVAFAAANGWNAFDFMGNYQDEIIAPDMTDAEKEALIQTPEVKEELEYTTVTLSSAVFDGFQAHITLTVTPKDASKTLVLPAWCDAQDPVDDGTQTDANFYDVQTEGAEKNYVTYAEKAAEENKQIVYVNAYCESDGGNEKFNDDGSVTLYLYKDFEKEVTGEQSFKLALNERLEGEDSGKRVDTSFTLTAKSEITSAKAEGEYKLDYVTVESVEMNRSSTGAYMTIKGSVNADITPEQVEAFTYTDICPFVDGQRIAGTSGWFAVYDANGESMDAATVTGGEPFELHDNLAAGEALPEKITLKLYNYDKAEYGAEIEVPLTVVSAD